MIKKVNTYKAVRFRVCFLAAEGETCSTTLRRHLSNKHCINWTKSVQPINVLFYMFVFWRLRERLVPRHYGDTSVTNIVLTGQRVQPINVLFYI